MSHSPPRRSYFHRGGAEPLLGSTIPEHFLSVVERYREREAAVFVPQNRRHVGVRRQSFIFESS